MYFISVFLAQFGGEIFEKLREVCSFEVSMINQKRDYPWENNACIYMENSNWEKRNNYLDEENH